MIQFIRQKTISVVMHRMSNYFLIALIFGCLFSYVYFANMAVRAVTLLGKVEDKSQSLSVKVSELEAKRLLVDNIVSLENAKHLGFVEVSNQTFIVNKPKNPSLSLKMD
jgi:hypothetical protein